MKRINDFSEFTNILPYASEIFGVYQPLIGWKAKRVLRRIEQGFANDVSHVLNVISKKFKGRFEFTLTSDRSLQSIRLLEPAELASAEVRTSNSFVMESISRELPPLEKCDDAVWERLIKSDRIKDTLTRVVIPQITEWHTRAVQQPQRGEKENLNELVADQLNRESVLSGYLVHLKENKQFDKLKDLFYKQNHLLAKAAKLVGFRNPLDYFDPFRDIERVGLSPIGIVHLFRQYFFEFDTFLGTPVHHVWLSPGSEVELIEISSRKTVIERTTESTLDSTTKSERTTSEKDEISDAVKQDNKSDTKFGVNTSANQSWIGGSASASANLDITNTQSKAREVAHKRMREQTEKLSTEIRKSFKTTFKTITESSDTSSKRYVLRNKTDNLINYELRRKMRQVGVQVQDIGTYLCWQTYVDDPGKQLGVSKLVHLAKDPESAGTPSPDSIPMPTPLTTSVTIDIPFVPRTEDTLPDEDMHEVYVDGIERNTDDNEGEEEKIQADFHGFTSVCEQPGYQFLDPNATDPKNATGTIEFDYGGSNIQLSVRNLVEEPQGRITFSVHVDNVNFAGVSPIRVVAKVTWQPTLTLINEVTTKNLKLVETFKQVSKRDFEKAFVEAARDRINKASQIEPRKFDDLREEERIVVYRSLIQEMLTRDLPQPDDRTRHVVSELLNTIFDVDKMLYFVAPEWWRPRLHQSRQSLGGIRKPVGTGGTGGGGSGVAGRGIAKSIHREIKALGTQNLVSQITKSVEDKTIAPMDTVSWGGTQDNRVDNYYITEESAPARLGSSLGWLLQLDGDRLRNAFLNAPWVKAVIPIRPGMEQAAINWLQRLHVEGTEGLDDQYVAPPGELAKIPHTGPHVTVRDAINHLCKEVARKHQEAMQVDRFPKEEINDDNRVSSAPVEKVYEHGFYPLQGGFRARPGNEGFEIFDQWIEILPTDQVVPVEVKYDPKTGRQV